jgi:hypothetical protein
VLLVNLEKEKELLRIFMRVSELEDAIFKSMKLKSFLHGKSRDCGAVNWRLSRANGQSDWLAICQFYST